MADNMCGPSSGAKSFLEHTDRDRSRHQDRLAHNGNSSAGESFRSQATQGAIHDMGFQAAQAQHMMPHPEAFHAQPPLSHMAMMGFAAGAHGSPMTGAPIHAPPVAHFQQAGHAPQVNGNSQDWVNQFSGLHHNAASPANQSISQPFKPPPFAGHQGVPMASHLGMPMMGQSLPMYAPTFHNAGPVGTPYVAQAGIFSNHAATVDDDEAFANVFGAYAEAYETSTTESAAKKQEPGLADPREGYDFAPEIVALWEKERQLDEDFIAAQDEWMAEHGPNAVERMAENLETTHLNPEPAVEQPVRREDKDLARAAFDIVSSVSNNNSDKFKNSAFFELMRRIGNSEIVVEGPNLVDAVTGEAIAATGEDKKAAETSEGMATSETAQTAVTAETAN
ncbi:hypothetical protein B0H63DRAFT_205956 [Podospora didyma]|uniref:Peroxin 20 n=1 Tax=Podospora didyma TaxID=330526 RepID=A0AAE0NH72_9PEZI|nr:hypothetical protein B0H63DRAFT_205956 [Podospora didyma]